MIVAKDSSITGGLYSLIAALELVKLKIGLAELINFCDLLKILFLLDGTYHIAIQIKLYW